MTEEEILQILRLIENSSFDFMQLECGDLKLTVSKSGYVPGASPPASGDAATAARPGVQIEKREAEAGRAQAGPKTAAQEGTLPVKAPMVGTFYTTPSPGAPPFIAPGDRVEEDSTVGLIEVMKVFNAVSAGARGVISEICVENGQFVEYGQTLFLITPES